MSELNKEIEEDFLSVDTPIPGQNYTCLSFVSPEKELANKNIFMIHNFLKNILVALRHLKNLSRI